MTAELPDRQRSPISARVLNTWLREAQTKPVSREADRLVLASTVAVAALQRAIGSDHQPLLLKVGC